MKVEFDQFAKTYREEHNKNLKITGHTSTYFAAYKAKKLFDWTSQLIPLKPNSILDFGCGDGTMTEQVRLLFPQSKLFGVDPSEESIIIAQKNFPFIKFQKSSSKLSMFKSASLDIIFTAAVFHHIPFHDHQHYIKELIRVLKKHGILIIFEHNPFNPITQYLFNTCPLDVNATMMTPTYTKNLIKQYGKITTKFYGFFPKILERFQFLEPNLENIPLGALYAVILQKN